MKRTKPPVNSIPKHLQKCPQVYNKVKTNLNLTPKEKIFVQEYLYDWNISRAARAAGYSQRNAPFIGNELLKKPKIKRYIQQVHNNLEKHLGLSKMRVLHEHMKIGFSSIAHLHDTWITRREFQELTSDEKACISEITTQVRRLNSPDGEISYVEFVKIKLYDKQRALDAISKMVGYDAPQEIHVKSEQEINLTFRSIGNYLSDLSNTELRAIQRLGVTDYITNNNAISN